jgi:hypothetical protein
MTGGMGWMAFGILTNSIPSILANSLFIVINCRGFWRWKKDGRTCRPEEPAKK